MNNWRYGCNDCNCKDFRVITGPKGSIEIPVWGGGWKAGLRRYRRNADRGLRRDERLFRSGEMDELTYMRRQARSGMADPAIEKAHRKLLKAIANFPMQRRHVGNRPLKTKIPVEGLDPKEVVEWLLPAEDEDQTNLDLSRYGRTPAVDLIKSLCAVQDRAQSGHPILHPIFLDALLRLPGQIPVWNRDLIDASLNKMARRAL